MSLPRQAAIPLGCLLLGLALGHAMWGRSLVNRTQPFAVRGRAIDIFRPTEEEFAQLDLPRTQRLQSVYGLPELLKTPTESDQHQILANLYDVVIEQSSLVIPPGMLAKMAETGKDSAAFSSQTIVSIFDLSHPDNSVAHNKLRYVRYLARRASTHSPPPPPLVCGVAGVCHVCCCAENCLLAK